jgi:hypothetical protein
VAKYTGSLSMPLALHPAERRFCGSAKQAEVLAYSIDFVNSALPDLGTPTSLSPERRLNLPVDVMAAQRREHGSEEPTRLVSTLTQEDLIAACHAGTRVAMKVTCGAQTLPT